MAKARLLCRPNSSGSNLRGRHLFEHGEFGLLRTRDSVATFSWGRQVMGRVLPLQKDLLLTPNPRGLIGFVEMPGSKKEAPRVKEVRVAPLPDALGVAGILSRRRNNDLRRSRCCNR